VFNLFRKDKTEDLMAFLKEGMPDAKSGPSARVGHDTADEGGIQVEEAGGGLAAELEEAAVLYANGRVGDAAALLNRYILDHPELRDPQPWYMLFDLYEASGQAEHFEDAAVDFAVRFERSPPTWDPRTQVAQEARTNLPYMGFGATFGPADKARMQRFLQENAGNKSGVRIDVTRAPLPDEDYTRALLDCLVTLQERRTPIQIVGPDNLIARINAARGDDGLAEPAWLLLLTLLQLCERQTEFEDLAVDYAVRFEVSPPSYGPPRRVLEAPTRAQSGAAPSGFTFPLCGVLGASGDNQLVELKAFAEDKPQVEIDLSQLTRIEFACIGLLLDTLISLSESGHNLLFKEGNELVNVLLNIVGAGQFAMILGRTRA
jgi:ABC-type transporter Mla MlaB component